MRLFDLHCDTPYELYLKKEKLEKNKLHISIEKASAFEKYVQCAAVWSDSKLSDGECFELFSGACDYFEMQCGGFIKTARSLANSKKNGFILTVEDSRLVDGKPENVDLLYFRGVRVMTLLWGEKSSVGSAWNADGELTSLGKDILERCFDVGIVPDISHANDEVSSYVLKRAKKRHLPVIATHSDSRAVCPHKRNMTDETARHLASVGGIIGISLYPLHLRGERADISDIINHIKHYINTVGSQAVCLGCDLDGIDSMPEGINSVGDLPLLYEALSHSLGSSVADCVFYNNAYNFFINNLPQ